MKQKVVYLGKIQLSDVDLSYIHEAQHFSDITYIIEINPRFMQGPAFNIKEIHPKSGLFKAVDIYPEFQKLEGFINLNKTYVLNTCGKFWLIKSFWTNILLLLFLIRQQFQIIHLTWPPNIYEFVLYFLREKMLLTVHDPFPHSGLDSFIVRLRRKVAFSLISHFIILNEAQRGDFLAYYHLLEKKVINSKLSCYTYLQTITPDFHDIPPKNSYILFAGKISPYKGLDYLLPAMEKVHKICSDCRLIIAGGGIFHFDISEYKSRDYIEIRNRFIPDTELVALIKNCAFMVCPYTDATQSGVIMSAFAFNKPVIATNVGGLPEMVRHHHYGLIIKEKSIDDLAAAIISIWKQSYLRKSYAEEIRLDYGTGDKSWFYISKMLCEEYNKICK